MENISFSSEINNHRSSLQSFAMGFTKDFDDAKDLVQDTFMKALRYSSLYKEGTNLKAWLYTIMKNTYINDYRKAFRKNQVIETKEDLQSHQLLNSASNNRGVESLMGEDIHKALKNLDAVYLIPFIRFFEGYKYCEIAEELNIPLGTVKTRIHEARKHLKNSLKMYSPTAA